MKSISFHHRIAAIIGNLLEHYDKALFGLLAPSIAPLFFLQQEPLTALILTYAILPLGAIARPIGSLFFGWLGDTFGRGRALFYSLTGMAFVTFSMGCLPTCAQVGDMAPLFLALMRMLQAFFAAGDAPGAAIFILEQTSEKKRELVGSIYDATSIAGILLASGLITVLSACDIIENGWRWLFWLGASSGFVGIYLRRALPNSFERIKKPVLKILADHKAALVRIMFVSGFSYVTYCLSFTLMNGFIPLVTSLSPTQVLAANSALLVVDMLLLPCFGYAASRFGKEKMMLLSAIASFILAIPLFSLLPEASVWTAIGVRFCIVFFGVIFAAPYHAWALDQVAPESRYTILSLGNALGSQAVGGPCAAISLWLYKTTLWWGAPALYLMCSALLATTYVLYGQKKVAVKALEC